MECVIPYSSVGEEHFGISTDYAAFVGANLFAPDSLNVRINSHLQTPQPRNLVRANALKFSGKQNVTAEAVIPSGLQTFFLDAEFGRLFLKQI